MKITKILLVAVCLISVAVAAMALIKPASDNASADKGFAVVELFTSEGCSSCPTADAVIAKVQKESVDRPVYILAYHVDYWNRLGWRDAFSNAAYSKRQYQYSSRIKGSSVYTPQVVVNGTKEFIGSEEGTLRNAIKAGEQKAAVAELSLKDVRVSDGKLNFVYQADGFKDNTSLVYAVVQHAAQTKVEAGENKGRTLSHVQIVRELQTAALNNKGSGNAAITLPKGLNPRDMELIAFLQNQANGEIIAACRSDLDATKMEMAN